MQRRFPCDAAWMWQGPVGPMAMAMANAWPTAGRRPRAGPPLRLAGRDGWAWGGAWKGIGKDGIWCLDCAHAHGKAMPLPMMLRGNRIRRCPCESCRLDLVFRHPVATDQNL